MPRSVKKPRHPELAGERVAPAGARFAVVASRFNDLVVDPLVVGALEALSQCGVAASQITVVRVPGAFELPFACARLVSRGKVDGIVALGCVVRGETPHFDYVAGEAARGINNVAITSQIPIGFGLLTTETVEQALARAGGKWGNKGWDAAMATVEMVSLGRALDGNGAGRRRAGASARTPGRRRSARGKR